MTTDPFDALTRRLDATGSENGRDAARDAAIEALQERWLPVYSELAQQARRLVERLREREDVTGDVRPTEYGFCLRLAATVAGGRRECSVGFPHALRAADIHVVEEGEEESDKSTVAWVKLPASDHEISFAPNGRIGWVAEDGEPAKADSSRDEDLRAFLTDLVAQELFIGVGSAKPA